MQADDRPGMSERYTRALESRHLEVKESLGDVDLLIAAGWCSERLGTRLYRLRKEFDSVRAEYRRADLLLRATAAASRDKIAGAKRATYDRDARIEEAIEHAELDQQAAEDQALVSRALIMVQLKSLKDTMDAAHGFAVVWATRKRFMRDNAVAMRICSRAMSLWMDPNCTACNGIGYRGGHGTPRIRCSKCAQTGKRALRLDDTDAGHEFGRSLLTEWDRKTDLVGYLMKRYLATR
jgi:hypothetical protein